MSKAKAPQGKGKQPRKHVAKALRVDPFKGSITILTQDPNVNGGVLVSPDSPYEMHSPGTVIICGPLVLPGQNFTIQARTFGTQKDTKGQRASIDTSGLDGTSVPPFPRLTGYGGDGASGVRGGSGMNAGDIAIRADTYHLDTSLPVSADGGAGGKGQNGQDGEMGGNDGKGGRGGDGGNGAVGGNGGTITIEYRNPPAPQVDASVKPGQGGAGGLFGVGGVGGYNRDGSPRGKVGALGKFGIEGSQGQEGKVFVEPFS
jgi:hypothetical protein